MIKLDTGSWLCLYKVIFYFLHWVFLPSKKQKSCPAFSMLSVSDQSELPEVFILDLENDLCWNKKNPIKIEGKKEPHVNSTQKYFCDNVPFAASWNRNLVWCIAPLWEMKWDFLLYTLYQCLFCSIVLKKVRVLMGVNWRRSSTPNTPEAWDFSSTFRFS